MSLTAQDKGGEPPKPPKEVICKRARRQRTNAQEKQ